MRIIINTRCGRGELVFLVLHSTWLGMLVLPNTDVVSSNSANLAAFSPWSVDLVSYSFPAMAPSRTAPSASQGSASGSTATVSGTAG